MLVYFSQINYNDIKWKKLYSFNKKSSSVLYINFSCLSYNTFYKLFGSKSVFYGFELWALKSHCIETMHTYACIPFVTVHTRSCNDAVLGDLVNFQCMFLQPKDKDV